MEFTFETLKKKTVAQLREIASGIEHEAIRGYTQLNKEHLIIALCNALGIDPHEHHRAEGIDKGKIKNQIRQLKVKRDEAIAAHNQDELKSIRRELHKMKRQLRKALV